MGNDQMGSFINLLFPTCHYIMQVAMFDCKYQMSARFFE